jgi:hypothetical protein
MLDRLMDLYHQYFNQFMTWYNASDFLTQVVVLVILGVVVLCIIGFIMMSKTTK